MSLKQLPPEERPRERLFRLGEKALSSAELLAILLGSGTKKKSVLELARDLLTTFQSVEALFRATLTELESIDGIGRAKALQLKAAFSLAHRQTQKERPKIADAAQIYQLVRPLMEGEKQELLIVLLRDVRENLVHQEILFRGTLTELIIHPREIFHLAVRHHAHSFVLVHNHPSGDPTPSARDLEMTKSLLTASRMMGIFLADHLIVGNQSYFSLKEAKAVTF